jgi:hypothetical protein
MPSPMPLVDPVTTTVLSMPVSPLARVLLHRKRQGMRKRGGLAMSPVFVVMFSTLQSRYIFNWSD